MTLLQLAPIGSGGSRGAGRAWLLPCQHWVPGRHGFASAAIGWGSAWQWAGLINRDSLPQRSAAALSAKGGLCVSMTTKARGAIAGGLMLIQPVGALPAGGLIVLPHPGQRVASRSPAALADAALSRLSEITDAPLLHSSASDVPIDWRQGRQAAPLIRPWALEART